MDEDQFSAHLFLTSYLSSAAAGEGEKKGMLTCLIINTVSCLIEHQSQRHIRISLYFMSRSYPLTQLPACLRLSLVPHEKGGGRSDGLFRTAGKENGLSF